MQNGDGLSSDFYRFFFYRSFYNFFLLLTASSLLFLLSSCVPKQQPILPPQDDVSVQQPGTTAVSRTGGRERSSTPTDKYIIQAGDEIEIDFFGDYNLDQVMDVRPDGFMSLALIGDVKADGLSVEELISELEARYSREVNNPRLNVIVRTFSSNVVFIGGDVKEPSAIHFDGKITILQAISLAGGFNSRSAVIDQVLVLRRQPGKPAQRYIVDLTKIIDGTDISQDIYLYQYDTVYVPSKL